MEEQTITNEDTERDPTAESSDVPAPETAQEAAAPMLHDASLSLEEIVRSEVERRLAEIFPARRETPRGAEAISADIKSEDHLRLGYGSREPHT